MQNNLLRRLACAAALSLPLALASSAHAGAATPAAPADAVQIKAAASYEPTLLEQADVLGRYKLSNGKIIEFSQGGLHYYSQVDGRLPVEMYPRGPGVFVSASGATLTFRDNGDQLVIDAPDRRLTAAR